MESTNEPEINGIEEVKEKNVLPVKLLAIISIAVLSIILIALRQSSRPGFSQSTVPLQGYPHVPFVLSSEMQKYAIDKLGYAHCINGVSGLSFAQSSGNYIPGNELTNSVEMVIRACQSKF